MTLVKGINNKDPNFEVDDIIRISKYENIFVKGYTPNWFEEIFVIEKVKNIILWTDVSRILDNQNQNLELK